MNIHFFKIILTLNKFGFAKETLNKILHKMASTILATIGIKTGFNASYIINKIIDDMIFHQIKKTSLSHEFDIIFICTIGLIKMKIDLSLFIHSHNIKLTLG